MSMNGRAFGIDQANYQAIAPKLAETIPLRFVVNEADLWVKTTGVFSSYIGLLALYLGASIAISTLFVFAFFVFWHYNKSAFYTPSISNLVYWISMDFSWIMLALLGIFYLARNVSTASAATALGYFFLFRLNVFQYLLDTLHQKWKRLSLNDRLIQMVIVKQSILNGFTISLTEDMQKNWTERYQKWSQPVERKKKKNK